MVRAFLWKKGTGDVNIKSLNDLLNALKNVNPELINNELSDNLITNKRFLVKWLEENFPRNHDLIITIKEFKEPKIIKLQEVLIQKLLIITEK